MTANPPPPAWWIPGPHGQTLWGKLVRRPRNVVSRIERWDTPDGDFLDIHRLDAPRNSPRVLVLHGLEGSIRSHYALGLLSEFSRRGWGADVMIFRSCGGLLNRGLRSYHSGETTDLSFVLDRISGEFPDVPLALVGISLGGNVLLKYLGERGRAVSPRIRGAVAISVPFDLSASADRIDHGFSRVYQQFFLRSLRRKGYAKAIRANDPTLAQHALRARTIREFDELVTAPTHGFLGAEDYYTRSSAINFLRDISINTLLLSAADDPFLPPEVLSRVIDATEDNTAIQIEFLTWGGHVGFVGGKNPLRPIYYLEIRTGEFLAPLLKLE
jgi:uncharacterized protein